MLAAGGGNPHVRHEKARVHHATQRSIFYCITLVPATDLSSRTTLLLVYSDPNCVSFDFGVPLAACLFADAPWQLRPRPLRPWPDKRGRVGWPRLRCDRTMLCWRPCRATEGRAHEAPTRCHHLALAVRERKLNGQTRKGCNDMRTTWCVALFAASAMMGTIDALHAQPEENPGRNEFLRSCAPCHGVSGKGDGPVAKSLSSPHPI